MIELCHWVTVPLLWSSLCMNHGYRTDWPALLAEVLLRSWHFSWTKLSGRWAPWTQSQSLRASCGHAAPTTTIWNGAWSKWPIFAWTERFHRKRCSQLTFLVRKVSRKGNLTQMAWLISRLSQCNDLELCSLISMTCWLVAPLKPTLRMIHVWLWKLQSKPKLLALLDQHLPPEDAVQIRSVWVIDYPLNFLPKNLPLQVQNSPPLKIDWLYLNLLSLIVIKLIVVIDPFETLLLSLFLNSSSPS